MPGQHKNKRKSKKSKSKAKAPLPLPLPPHLSLSLLPPHVLHKIATLLYFDGYTASVARLASASKDIKALLRSVLYHHLWIPRSVRGAEDQTEYIFQQSRKTSGEPDEGDSGALEYARAAVKITSNNDSWATEARFDLIIFDIMPKVNMVVEVITPSALQRRDVRGEFIYTITMNKPISLNAVFGPIQPKLAAINEKCSAYEPTLRVSTNTSDVSVTDFIRLFEYSTPDDHPLAKVVTMEFQHHTESTSVSYATVPSNYTAIFKRNFSKLNQLIISFYAEGDIGAALLDKIKLMSRIKDIDVRYLSIEVHVPNKALAVWMHSDTGKKTLQAAQLQLGKVLTTSIKHTKVENVEIMLKGNIDNPYQYEEYDEDFAVIGLNAFVHPDDDPDEIHIDILEGHDESADADWAEQIVVFRK